MFCNPVQLLLLVRQQVKQWFLLLENCCNVKSLTSISVNLCKRFLKTLTKDKVFLYHRKNVFVYVNARLGN